MFGGAEALEIRILIKKRLDKIEEMLKRVMPETGIEESDTLTYTECKLEEIGCKELPTSEMYTEKDWDNLMKFRGKEPVMAILYALCIGFANGVKWKNKDLNNF